MYTVHDISLSHFFFLGIEQGDMKGFDEMVVPDTAQRVKLEDFVQEYLLKV